MDGVQSEIVHCIGDGIVLSTSFDFGPSRSFFSPVPTIFGWASTSHSCTTWQYLGTDTIHDISDICTH
jgi:hypothetical protein